MRKILIEKIIREIVETPGSNTAAKFNMILDNKVNKNVRNPILRKRIRSAVALEMIKIRQANRENVS